jgi:hypothetical protein
MVPGGRETTGGTKWQQGYADDIAVLINGNFTRTVSQLMQKDFRRVEKLCKNNGLYINPDKMAVVPFNSKKK